jgi:hypothetical protein
MDDRELRNFAQSVKGPGRTEKDSMITMVGLGGVLGGGLALGFWGKWAGILPVVAGVVVLGYAQNALRASRTIDPDRDNPYLDQGVFRFMHFDLLVLLGIRRTSPVRYLMFGFALIAVGLFAIAAM